MERIPVARPLMDGNEKKYVLDCLDTNWISSNGKYITQFEEAFARYCDVKHAIATNNGTTALHLALVALGIGPNEEVIIPTVTYIATANAVKYCGATPVLVDVSADTLNIDPALIESKITAKTRGIIPVHLYGHPANMQEINELAQKHKLWVLEDAAEAHGAEVKGQKIGGLSLCTAFSFFGNKIITTGEGGMLTTNDDVLADRLRLLRGQGMDPKRRYWFIDVGYNYRMTNIQAAIGLAQLENIDKAIADRFELAGWYNQELVDLQEQLRLPTQAIWAKQVFWMYTIYLKSGNERQRDKVMQVLDQLGIETRPVFYPMHVLPPYKEDNTYPVADTWSQRGINLPTYQGLTHADVKRIAQALKQALSTL